MLREQISILVVDDVHSMRTQIKELLTTFGFQRIDMASSGEEAKAALEKAAYQLVLCDWHMSPGDGLDVLKFVRTHPALKDIPFIMVTADSTKEKVIEAIKSGVDDYLVKPLTAVQIETKVYSVLLRKKVLA